MGSVIMQLAKLKCLRCGYEWYPRTEKRPGVCPRCKCLKWDEPRRVFPSGSLMPAEFKKCSRCGETRKITDFQHRKQSSDGYTGVCKICIRKSCSASKHKLGYCNSMEENRNCGQYLGIHIAERVLIMCGMFQGVERATNNTRGYDFICSKGFKIDVKSATMRTRGNASNPYWIFHIDHNKIADWFVVIAFDDRINLTPLHIWMIPGAMLNHLTGLSITNSQRSLGKWKKFERPIDQLSKCCDKLKS